MTSIIVVGSGAAGLATALPAARAGARVTVLTKAGLSDTATARAQGGMAAMTGEHPGSQSRDSVALHVQDTVVAGAGLCEPRVVHGLVEDSADAVDHLVEHGVAFDREAGPGSPWVQGLEAAHSVPRILHAGGDATGRVIQSALTLSARRAHRRRDIRLLEYTLVTRIVVEDGRTMGVTARSVGRDGTLGPEEFHRAHHVVLATGGAGRLYPSTTNPEVATGDGIALALRAGAEVRDLEFFQFHPTALAAPGSFLISEAVRGEGAVLRDHTGHRFMVDADPRAELAPRNVVARAVFEACLAAPDGAARLDCSAVPVPEGVDRAEFLARRFPTIDRELRERGIEWAVESVPVSPAAHYHMGGIRTDELGRSTVPGLWAAGECASSGVHGANRLASNSLLEAVVFGRRIGEYTAAHWPPAPEAGAEATRELPLPGAGADLAPAEPFTREALQATMWRHAGVLRTAKGLHTAKARVEEWLAAASSNSVMGEDGEGPDTLAEHEDRNLLTVGHALVTAALARSESRGAHQRTDHPDTDPRQATSRSWHARATHAPLERTIHAASLSR